MAVSYQSVATTAYATSSDIVIAKPSGLAVGDLMIGVVQALGITDNASITSSGWTQSTGSTAYDFEILYKIATSGDVAASNFTFTTDGSKFCAGAIVRIQNGAGANMTVGTMFNAGSSSTPVYTTGITPTEANALLLFFTFATGTFGTATVSNYAITTSNPSWTESYDQTGNGTADGVMAMAYATRPETTGTGDFSCTYSGSVSSGGLLISVPEKIDVTVSPAVIGVVASVQAPSVSADANVTIASTLSVTASVQAPTVSMPADTWTNQDKSSSSWTNTDKS